MAEPLTLGAILCEARRRYGWTLRDAERATGIPNAHISQLETGAIAAPGITVLVKLAKAYGLPLRRLLDAAGQGADWALVTEASEAEIRADERQRIYAELGNEHYVIFTEDRFTVEHSVECKLSGHMHECAYHEAVALIADEFDPDRLGRWRITGISEGLPDLERAEREPG